MKLKKLIFMTTLLDVVGLMHWLNIALELRCKAGYFLLILTLVWCCRMLNFFLIITVHSTNVTYAFCFAQKLISHCCFLKLKNDTQISSKLKRNCCVNPNRFANICFGNCCFFCSDFCLSYCWIIVRNITLIYILCC